VPQGIESGESAVYCFKRSCQTNENSHQIVSAA
jgi:hypothetical protein